ncbi:MAG: hypothetical protein ACTSYD_02070 [Candidatus Heimdallarchaeaceae archaeon]
MLQVILESLIALPLVGTVIAGLLGLSVASVLGIFFPFVNNLILGGALLIGAVYIPDVIIYKGKKWSFGTSSVLAMAGLLIIVAGFLGISPNVFSGTILATAGNVVVGEIPQMGPLDSDVAVSSEASQFLPKNLETTSILNILLVFGITFATISVYKYLIGGKRKFKKRKGKR